MLPSGKKTPHSYMVQDLAAPSPLFFLLHPLPLLHLVLLVWLTVFIVAITVWQSARSDMRRRWRISPGDFLCLRRWCVFNGASPSTDAKMDATLPVYSHDDGFQTTRRCRRRGLQDNSEAEASEAPPGGRLQYSRYNDKNLISNNLSPVWKLRSVDCSSGCLIFVGIFTFLWFLMLYISRWLFEQP